MATTRFETTIKALQDLASLKADAAVKNIDGWESYLKTHDHEGVKKVVADLEKLKHLLQAEELDDKKIRPLLEKLGKETAAIAGDGEGGNAAHIKQLGEALQNAL